MEGHPRGVCLLALSVASSASPLSHWPELKPKVTSDCEEDWEMWLHCVTGRKGNLFLFSVVVV